MKRLDKKSRICIAEMLKVAQRKNDWAMVSDIIKNMTNETTESTRMFFLLESIEEMSGGQERIIERSREIRCRRYRDHIKETAKDIVDEALGQVGNDQEDLVDWAYDHLHEWSEYDGYVIYYSQHGDVLEFCEATIEDCDWELNTIEEQVAWLFHQDLQSEVLDLIENLENDEEEEEE